MESWGTTKGTSETFQTLQHNGIEVLKETLQWVLYYAERRQSCSLFLMVCDRESLVAGGNKFGWNHQHVSRPQILPPTRQTQKQTKDATRKPDLDFICFFIRAMYLHVQWEPISEPSLKPSDAIYCSDLWGFRCPLIRLLSRREAIAARSDGCRNSAWKTTWQGKIKEEDMETKGEIIRSFIPSLLSFLTAAQGRYFPVFRTIIHIFHLLCIYILTKPKVCILGWVKN